jgi:hypothetical protein
LTIGGIAPCEIGAKNKRKTCLRRNKPGCRQGDDEQHTGGDARIATQATTTVAIPGED